MNIWARRTFTLLLLPLLAFHEDSSASDTDDPLYRYQWHLKNVGQRAIGDVLPTAGVDLNMGRLYEQGVTGKGVIVGVNEGAPIDPTNPDLADNLIIKTVQPDSAYLSGSTGAHAIAAAGHSTAVAGIIGARAHNGIGGRGIAPDVRILDLHVPEAKGRAMPRVVNVSAGGTAPIFLPQADEQDEDDRLDDRNKSLLVVSAGNEFLGADGISQEVCAEITRGSGVSCLPGATNMLGSLPNALAVGAINANGVKSSYSSTGSVIWVSAPGGEYGMQRNYLRSVGDAGKINGMPAYMFSPAIVTTDRVGCDRGMKTAGDNFFDNRGKPSALNPRCLFTARMNGTSSAAPMVTGVTALMLQVNPKLTWREIKYILATTARRIDRNRPDVLYHGTLLEKGWVRNAAGHYFSNAYGFGLVDATRAVAAARHFSPLPEIRDSRWITYAGTPVPVGYRNTSGRVRVTARSRLKIETVHIRLKTTHPTPSNLRVTVVSPSGTVSTVLTGLAFLVPTPDGFEISLASSNAFLDEDARGTWTVQVTDVLDPSARSKYRITQAGIRIFGRAI